MDSALDPGSSGRLSHGPGAYCAVFFGKTFDSHNASLHPGGKMVTGEFNAAGDPVMN